MKMKLLVLMLIVSLFGVCIVACGDSLNSESSVKKYLKDNGFKNCKIEGELVEEDSKQYWNIYDEKNDINFNILQKNSPGGPYASSLIYDNYDSKLAEKNINEFPNHDGVEIITDDMWSEAPIFKFEFESLEEYETKTELIKNCAKYLAGLKADAEITVSPVYMSERAKLYKENGAGDIFSTLESARRCPCSEIEDGGILNKIKQNYFDLGYYYHFSEIEDEMKDSDIEKFWSNEYNHYCIAVYRSGNPDDKNNKDFEVHNDICCDGATVTFGNLYKLLVEEGFDVEGDIENFTVKDVNGAVCQFSYENVCDGKNSTYYLVDGEQVSSDINYFSIDCKTINDLFGLTIRSHVE